MLIHSTNMHRLSPGAEAKLISMRHSPSLHLLVARAVEKGLEAREPGPSGKMRAWWPRAAGWSSEGGGND